MTSLSFGLMSVFRFPTRFRRGIPSHLCMDEAKWYISQHFQGLRRTQSKAEPGTDGVSAESPRNLDPSQNPITRRPGPGRGRPRKKPATPVEMPNRDKNQLPAPASVPVSLSASGPDPEPLALDPSLVAADEQAAKRPRLDDDPQDPSLEDEAVLNALAAHTNPNVVDHYGQEYANIP